MYEHKSINEQCARELLGLHKDVKKGAMIRVYCDTGGFDRRLTPLVQDGRIALHTFKYENRNGRIQAGAIPSDLRYDDTAAYTYDDMRRDTFLHNVSSDEMRNALARSRLNEIIAVVGKDKRVDAKHLDSAQMTGCRAFLTSDKDLAGVNRLPLEAITGVRIFRPADANDWGAFIEFIGLTVY